MFATAKPICRLTPSIILLDPLKFTLTLNSSWTSGKRKLELYSFIRNNTTTLPFYSPLMKVLEVDSMEELPSLDGYPETTRLILRRLSMIKRDHGIIEPIDTYKIGHNTLLVVKNL